jgi:hypothetical protein
MPRSKQVPVHSEPIPPRVVQLLGDFFVDQEMGGGFMELKPWQQDIARRSRGLRALYRTADESPDYVREMNITLVWQRCGSPEEKSPADWMADPDTGFPAEVFDDRGEAGVFVGWEEAMFYVHWMEPEILTIEDACELLYG